MDSITGVCHAPITPQHKDCIEQSPRNLNKRWKSAVQTLNYPKTWTNVSVLYMEIRKEVQKQKETCNRQARNAFLLLL